MDFSVPLLFLLSTFTNTGAHRSLPSGITCGSQFSSADTALTIPNPKLSWANYAIYTCEHPVNWLEAEASKNQQLKFTMTVPVLDRFENERMSAVFIGPGLPALSANASLPDSVKQYVDEMKMGAMIYHSPQDQSSCEHLTSPEMKDSTTVKDGRCHFYEPFSGSNLWVIMDEIITVPEAATYKIAVFEESGTTAKASFACCDWPEDFVTPFNIPEPTCPVCGSNTSNPAWTSLFYEHKTMEAFGGYPPLQICNNSAPIDLPSGDACPNIAAPSGNDQPDSCVLGCNKEGECHSHNALGECTYFLDWGLNSKFGDAFVKNIVIFKGDKIRFTSASKTLVHNLFKLKDDNALKECDFQGSEDIANVQDISIGHDLTFNEAGIYSFSCSIGCGVSEEGSSDSNSSFCHCQNGQKLTVEVKDSTDGLRCHDHKQPDNHHSNTNNHNAPLECSVGTIKARAVNNPNYGAMDNMECSELCSPAAAISFMTGVEIGSCSDIGFTSNPKMKNIKPAGSPMSIDVTVVKKPQTCHCHSYEKIVCPEDETPADTLYVEHIKEIEQYCTGILDNTEDDCPYKCFQPMEVLHLHYLECPSRSVHKLYKDINATNECHQAAIVDIKQQSDCPVVELGKKPMDTSSTGPWHSILYIFPIIASTIAYFM